MLNALDLNWGVRMSEVHVTGDPPCRELRSLSGCIGLAASPPIISHKKSSLSRIGNDSGHLDSGYAPEFGVAVSCMPESCRTQQTELWIADVPQQRTAVAGSRPSADTFVEERSKASAEDRSSSHLDALRSSSLDALRFSALTDPRTEGWSLRCHDGRERGLKLCR